VVLVEDTVDNIRIGLLILPLKVVRFVPVYLLPSLSAVKEPSNIDPSVIFKITFVVPGSLPGSKVVLAFNFGLSLMFNMARSNDC
jgi:hypothetical protein